jgi:hypothetical protein
MMRPGQIPGRSGSHFLTRRRQKGTETRYVRIAAGGRQIAIARRDHAIAAKHSDRSTMNDDKDKRERQMPKNPATDPRRDRLKLALRENLKRRKSQARGRSDAGAAPSNGDDVYPHDGGGKPGE